MCHRRDFVATAQITAGSSPPATYCAPTYSLRNIRLSLASSSLGLSLFLSRPAEGKIGDRLQCVHGPMDAGRPTLRVIIQMIRYLKCMRKWVREREKRQRRRRLAKSGRKTNGDEVRRSWSHARRKPRTAKKPLWQSAAHFLRRRRRKEYVTCCRQ